MKIKSVLKWLSAFLLFLLIPAIKAYFKVGGDYSATEILLFPFGILLLILGFILFFCIIGIILLFIYLFISKIIFQSDDIFNMYEKLTKSEDKGLFLLFKPVKIFIFWIWTNLRKNIILTNTLSSIVTFLFVIYLLWCWGIVKFNV